LGLLAPTQIDCHTRTPKKKKIKRGAKKIEEKKKLVDGSSVHFPTARAIQISHPFFSILLACE
jgi:hypothetical protein